MATGRLPDPNSSPLTAKGDLYTYSTVPAKLAVGSDGDTLVADSSATTGLRWTATPSASNPIINSAFQIAQRGTSFALNNAQQYVLDRWYAYSANTAATYSRQTTSDTTNLPFIQYCMRVARNSGATSTGILVTHQPMETVNSIPYAGKTVTLSFYARAGANYSATSNRLAVYLVSGTGTDQNFSGTYTGAAYPINNQTATLTTTWQRFTYTGTIASTATELTPYFEFTPTGTAGANDYFEITGVQLDVGSVALPFRTYSATLAGELAACQRYYHRTSCASVGYQRFSTAVGANSTTVAYPIIPLPVTLRALPTSIDFSLTGLVLNDGGTNTYAVTGLTIDSSTGANLVSLTATVASGLTQYRPYYLNANNSSSPYIGFSAEL